jgi:uncharacterized repeat protein (TIGR01451 family)
MHRFVARFICWIGILSCVIGVAQGQVLQYGLMSDNFQGQSGLPAGYVASGPSYPNFPDTSGFANLKTFAATPSNRNATEIVSALNFTNTSSGGQQYGLCNGSAAVAACANGKGWQGRVMYALLKFPLAGSYYFTLAHDDGAEVDLSGQLTISDPRTATYGTVLGGLGSYTSNDTTFDKLNNAPFVVSASACYLMRVYWNNQGGINHFRLRYGTQSNLSDQALVPPSQFLLPGVQANWESCTGPTLTLNKTSIGDVGSFTFTGTNGYSGETITTVTPGTAVSGTTFSLTNLNATTTVTETGPGSFALTGATCTDVNAAKSGNPTGSFGTVSGNVLTIPPAYIIAQAQIQCSLSNTKLGTPSVAKTSNGPWLVGQTGAKYTLTVRNNNSAGGSATTGTTTVLDTLPSAVTAGWTGTLTSGGFTCTFVGQSVTCLSAVGLAPGASVDVVLPVNVVSGGGTSAVNYSSIGGGGNPANGGLAPTPGPTCSPSGLCASTTTAILVQPTISKAFSPTPILLSSTSTVTFTLTNGNAVPLTNLNFTDALTNMKVANTTIGGTCSSGGIVSNTPVLAANAVALNLTVPVLAAGSSCTVTVVVQPTTTGALPNITSGVTSTQTTTPGAASNTATLTVTPSADLSITKTGPSTAAAGTTVTYLLTLTNNGPSPANGATFADNVPNGLTAVTATCQNASVGVSGCAVTVGSGNNVTGSVATFPVGGSVQVQITGLIPAGATAALSNKATIKAPATVTDPTDPTNTGAGNNTSATVATTLTKTADLSVTKTDSLTVVSSGQVLTYSIVVANAGPSTTTANFNDTVFSGVTLSNWTCSATTGTATCPSGLPISGGYTNSLLNLPAGSSITFQVTGTVTATSGTVSNTASVTAPGGVANSAGTMGATTTVTDTDTILSDLGLAKTGAAAAQPGSLVTYTLTVSNAGPSAATTATLTDSLPAGTSFSAADQAAGFSGVYVGTTSPQTVTWTFSNIAASGSRSVTLVIRMPSASVVQGDPATTPPTPGLTRVTNSATVSSPSDSVTTNNSATASTALILAELIKRVRNITADTRDNNGVARFGTTATGQPGEVLEYCITFRNLGGIALSGFVVTDDVPVNVDAVTGSGISLLRGGTGQAGSAAVSGGTATLLTSAEVAPTLDGGSLTISGGQYGKGRLTTALLTPLAVAESGQTCFRASIL